MVKSHRAGSVGCPLAARRSPLEQGLGRITGLERMASMVNPLGSTWKRWEPHVHSPETALNNQFSDVSLEKFLTTLERLEPALAGIGITDYFTTEGYRKVRDLQIRDSRLQGVLLFANIEMRLSIGTADDRAINVHLLVSPDDEEHLQKIDDHLARLQYRFLNEAYACTPEALRRLGRRWHEHSTGRSSVQTRADVEDVGALRLGSNQFKVDFTNLCTWREDPWLQANTILAVPNGGDGAGGLPRGDGTFASVREALRRSAKIIFTSNPSDRKYWLGQGSDSRDELARKYGGVKPCIHGSDAHSLDRLMNPGERLCWIKAEPTWRGFLQVLAEPDDRLFIGPVPPDPPRTTWIRRLEARGAPWCPSKPIELNPGLVAIIGSRGSGKTALADLIAFGAGAYEAGPASFLSKAREFVAGTHVSLTWGDETSSDVSMDVGSLRARDRGPESQADEGAVLYLSQHFVDSLCGAERGQDKLRAEVERVVFQRLEPEERLGEASFRDLLRRETATFHETKRVLEEEVRRRSELIAAEFAAEKRLPEMRKKLGQLEADLKRIRATMDRTSPPSAQKKQAALANLQGELVVREEALKKLALRVKTIRDLKLELATAAEEARRKSIDLLRRLRSVWPQFLEEEEPAFLLSFGGDHGRVLSRALEKLESEAERIRGSGDPPQPPGSYLDLKARVAVASKELRDAGIVEKQLADMIKVLAAKEQERKALGEQIDYTAKCRERVRDHQGERLAAFRGVVEQLVAEEAVLRRLYRPLEQELGGLELSAKRLSLVVRRRADVDRWVDRGERLFDMRKTHFITVPGRIRALAGQHLQPAWEGDADPAEAIKAVLTEIGEIPKLQDCFATGVSLEDMAEWLFSTEHVRIDYAIAYEGVDIEQLSPGTRGVVLLIIYLRLDRNDDRPLVIDQPEENLDPKSVFTDLVHYFKDARKRRQIIMVTHNANLVVNADADQVLIAQGARGAEPGPPHLAYQVGVLENAESQNEICSILEGGTEAFRQRERRYRIAMTGQTE
jgi:hypothetical protein